jgi:hypothetical protein
MEVDNDPTADECTVTVAAYERWKRGVQHMRHTQTNLDYTPIFHGHQSIRDFMATLQGCP